MNIHRNAAGKLPKKNKGSKNGPVETIKVDTRVMKKALQLAGGNVKRLKFNKDGSVIVK
jgi:hypothetical protein